jgi:chromosomal replication initiation ATPase DnaA
MGGKNPASAYRQFVESGIDTPPANPLAAAAAEGWILGSQEFVEQVKRLVKAPRNQDEVPQWKRLNLSVEQVVQAVAGYYNEQPESYSIQRNQVAGRDLAAWLVHRRTTATLREVARWFGLTHPDSASNLIRRAERQLSKSRAYQSDLKKIEQRLVANA